MWVSAHLLKVANRPGRQFWEIDCLRGIAIVMMITFHLLFDLTYFAGYNFNLNSGFWLIFARLTATIFIFLVGLSLTLSYSRATSEKKEGLCIKFSQRGLRIFGWGLAITLFTWLFLREGFIVFGILHLIGISIILAYPFLRVRRKFLLVLLGIFCLSAGLYLRNFTFDFYWLLWLGFRPQHFYTLDYFPILPWFGVVLIGIFVGDLLYPNHTRRFEIGEPGSKLNLLFIQPFSFLGRHSLIIYLAHQPVLVASLCLVLNPQLLLQFFKL